MKTPFWLCLLFLLSGSHSIPAAMPAAVEIQVVDEVTGRGIPLVELKTVDEVIYVTDSAGRVAFHEPGLMNRDVFFAIRSHGYEKKPDGFGIRGSRIHTRPGSRSVIKLRRINIAERLCRLTGAGIYRDSILLGKDVPLSEPLLNARILGQDSTQATVYQGKIHWFWGDTARLEYPLGNFRTTGAISSLPGAGGLDPSQGVNYWYFTNETGFARKMVPFHPEKHMMWIDGLFTLRDDRDKPRLVMHWSNMKSLGERTAHGLGVFNDETGVFDPLATLESGERWRCPRGTSFQHERFHYFCTPFPVVRVPDQWSAIRDATRYEAWTCLAEGSGTDAPTARVQRDAEGQLVYRWSRTLPPIEPALEAALVAAGKIREDEAWYRPQDVNTGKRIRMHNGSVRWNPWRKRWILIAVEQGGDSFLGEVWYAESESPTGPWRKACKVVTHDRYSFYNPVHHPFFDQEGGRVIYFEGTYASTFSGNENPTPRYNYNQVLYRLDLGHPDLEVMTKD